MCSIPGFPTPGSELPVLITRVNRNPSCGLVELWVNMDDGRMHVYKQMREEIQVPKRKFCGSEGKPGDLCLVCISDTWHRARIVSLQSETFNVFLIDQGQSHITTSDALAWGQSDSFLLPPETELCILANVLSLANERVSNFLVSLPGKKMTGVVQHVLMPDRTIVLDIPTVSKHMCKIGVAKKMPVDVFKCLVQKCLEAKRITQNINVSSQLEKHDQYFYPELLTDTYETVIVTEVTNPSNIFCKLLIFSKAVAVLSEQIQQHYEECSHKGEAKLLNCGDPCAARGMDGRWHRSLLKQAMTSDGVVEVLHVDKGKTEFVATGDIRPLHGTFLRMPVVTYPCSLEAGKDNGTGWTTDHTDYFKSLLLNQTFVAKFLHYNIPQAVYHVALYAGNGTHMTDCLTGKAGTFSLSKTEQDSNVLNEPIPLSFPGSLQGERCLDSQNKVLLNDGLLKGPLPHTKNLAANGGTDDVPTSGADDCRIKSSSDNPATLIQINGHVSTGFPSEVQNACDDDVFAVGTSVNVNISFIESLQKFWCQSMENGDSLRLLMQDLQNHYASAHPEPLVESICVARNPDNNMWYRARIIANQSYPVVDVRFIDYGQKQTVPLQDVRPIDPAFLRLNAQAFQCCLFNQKNSTNAAEIRELVELCASSNIGLKCIVKTVTTDEEGLLLNVVDIETPSCSACETQTLECAQTEGLIGIPSQVPSDAYNYSTHNIDVDGKEKVWITYSETVNQFYCQLDRNRHLFDKAMENINQLTGLAQCADQPLGLNSICFARYTDNQWYRGQVVEMSPTYKVHFVDYGHILEVNESDICLLPTVASMARSVPVQAVPLGLFEVPAEVPQKVNEWFADYVIGKSFTISVVAKEENGKLIVELFDGPLNVNVKVQEMISQTTQQKMTVSAPEIEHERKPTSDIILIDSEIESDSEITQLSLVKNVNICKYKWPVISQNKVEEVYTSCIVAPYYFWCQYANTEALNMVSRHAQEAGQTQQDANLTETLGPGSPCLALFSNDNQWYRAQVTGRVDNTFTVVFIDFGNESEIDSKNLRPLPQSLLAEAPQAFLCSLNGFDESRGSWDDNIYDDFYNLLVDKPLTVSVLSMEDYSEIMVPQYAVEIECEGVVVNAAVQKYWKPVAKKRLLAENPETQTSLQDGQTESNGVSKGNVNNCMYKKQNFSPGRKERVYASCIVEPYFFWCQYANTEELSKVSRLAQEAGRTQQDTNLPETLGPGSPCLALFSSDNQWYRAQVIRRVDNTFNMLFVDYGNESEVDIKNVRPLPHSLLEEAPRAFLCSLNGFDESRGSWDDKVYDDFYNLLVDKPLSVTVLSMGDHSEIMVPQYAVEIECEGVVVNAAVQKYWKSVAKKCLLTEHPETQTSLQDGQTESNRVSKGNVNNCIYKKPKISPGKKERVYASCIVEPHFFWCQYANTEELSKVSRLAQEAGQTQQDTNLPETLGPGSPCLALFSSDNQWYRAQVIRRDENVFSVFFIDYGNESEVDIKNVRSLPQNLLEEAPQAFLCSLNGFNKSVGSWNDEVYDIFFNLLVDKPLRVAVFNMEDHPEVAVPQYAVDVECEGVVVNTLMEKYWKRLD